MNGAELLCETLLINDIDVCFANPGTSEVHFVAALDRRPDLRCVLGLFEGVVTGAADGYARMLGKPACTLLHLGPGLANGLANLHNARRAFSPVVNIVGDHPAAHLSFDAPLTTDIESLARPMSNWVQRTASADNVGRDAASAIEAAMSFPRQVATLILPADAAWNETQGEARRCHLAQPQAPDLTLIDAAAGALRKGVQTTLLMSGQALRSPALEVASRIAQATGAKLLAPTSNSRIERGAGRVPIERVPYIVDQALAVFKDTEQLILIGAKAPVAFFLYPNKPSSVLPPTCRVIEMAGNDVDLLAALQALEQALGIRANAPINLARRAHLPLPQGRLTSNAIAQALTALMPEQAIVCDESILSGGNFFASSHSAEQHDYLQLTGGAIGIGMPLATGAAVACPDRKVITLQADGSGMYTVQALWTQARERLDVLTIVLANRSYATLHYELGNVGAGEPGRNAKRMFDLVDPALDWVSIARGMGVEAVRTDDATAFTDLLRTALKQRGPFLIEALI